MFRGRRPPCGVALPHVARGSSSCNSSVTWDARRLANAGAKRRGLSLNYSTVSQTVPRSLEQGRRLGLCHLFVRALASALLQAVRFGWPVAAKLRDILFDEAATTIRKARFLSPCFVTLASCPEDEGIIFTCDTGTGYHQKTLSCDTPVLAVTNLDPHPRELPPTRSADVGLSHPEAKGACLPVCWRKLPTNAPCTPRLCVRGVASTLKKPQLGQSRCKQRMQKQTGLVERWCASFAAARPLSPIVRRNGKEKRDD